MASGTHQPIDDPGAFAVNRSAPHSDHRWFGSREEALAGVSSYERCLNGAWRAHHALSPREAPVDFHRTDYDSTDWLLEAVPGHPELRGSGAPQYTNVQFPWDGREELRPGEVPVRHNPVHSYLTQFSLEQGLADGERLALVFHGVESALQLWVNGEEIGQAFDSFTPSEFDVSHAVRTGTNLVAVRVHRFSSGSWLEGQDFFRLSGLFRDVELVRRPAAHVEDLFVRSSVSNDGRHATVAVTLECSGGADVQGSLEGVGDLTEVAPGEYRIKVPSPRLWSPEDPHLYRLELVVRDRGGRVTEHVHQPVGIRTFQVVDGLLLLNGQRVVLKGVNRHEFGPDGRVLTPADSEADVVLLKQHNVNALRTSHYPNSRHLYDACDRHGILVIDEANVETHGVCDAYHRGLITQQELVPGDDPRWRSAVLDRGMSMLMRDRNHPSVVVWSCGNESLGGQNLFELAQLFRRLDPTRPVHYEGVNEDPRYPDTTDIASQMYVAAETIEDYLETHRDKPMILCEFAHAMGNSLGAVGRYVELAHRLPRFQGMFVWDFRDQALPARDVAGRTYWGYGGDFGDRPNDGDFCGNGLVFADGTPSPKLAELRKLYQPVRIEFDGGQVRITNDHLQTSTSALDFIVSVLRGSVVEQTRCLATSVAPGESERYELGLSCPLEGEYVVDLSFRLNRPATWAPAGFEVAWAQEVRGARKPLAPAGPAPHVVSGVQNLGVRTSGCEALFSRTHPGLTSLRGGDTRVAADELLAGVPLPNFWHAPTANERGWGMPQRQGQWLLASLHATASPDSRGPVVESGAEGVEVRYGCQLPTWPPVGCEVRYLVQPGGRIEVTLSMDRREGLPPPPEFGLLFRLPARYNQLRWHGDGPHESYRDRRESTRLGVWSADVREQLTPYLVPQEAGNHTGVRWASVTDATGRGLLFDAPAPMEFSALPWTPLEVQSASHHHELPPIHHTIVRPALMRQGVAGDDSWGAMPLPQYRLSEHEPLSFSFGVQVLAPGSPTLPPSDDGELHARL